MPWETGQREPIRTAEEDGSRYPSGTGAASDLGVRSPNSRQWSPPWLWVVGLTLIILTAGGWWATENWGFGGLSTVDRAYARLLRFGHVFGRPLRPSDTPFEWAHDLGTIVPEAREPIDLIVDLYVRACFARGNPGVEELEVAWEQARPALWRGWLRHALSLPRRH